MPPFVRLVCCVRCVVTWVTRRLAHVGRREQGTVSAHLRGVVEPGEPLRRGRGDRPRLHKPLGLSRFKPWPRVGTRDTHTGRATPFLMCISRLRSWSPRGHRGWALDHERYP